MARASKVSSWGPRRIDEEAVSVDALRYVLCTRCACAGVAIIREPKDPPDFTVTIDGEHFPAEVTSIVSGEQSRALYENLARAITSRASTCGGVAGAYALVVSDFPRIPRPSSTEARPLVEEALTYLSVTRGYPTAPAHRLLEDDAGEVDIQKVSARGSTIGVVWSGRAMYADEVQRQLATLIQQALDEKHGKLQRAGVDPKQTLLLLYDAFAYASPEDASAALRQVRGHDAFHSVFWAASFSGRENTTYREEPGRDGLFLFSRNPRWSSCGSTLRQTSI
jgi:hypothetical protein